MSDIWPQLDFISREEERGNEKQLLLFHIKAPWTGLPRRTPQPGRKCRKCGPSVGGCVLRLSYRRLREFPLRSTQMKPDDKAGTVDT